MKKSVFVLLSLILALSMFLVACNSQTTEAPPKENAEQPKEEAKVEPQYGGKVTYAFTQPFKGLLERGYYEGEDDDLILRFMTDSIVDTGDDLKPKPGIGTWEVSEDKKTYTFKIKQGVKWHNGDELTVEDWKYALEVLASPDYTGPRYSNVEIVQGAEEFRKGEAKSISGIEVVDPYTIKITAKKPMVNFLDQLWSYPMPKKYYEGIAVKDLPNSDKVRKNPIGLGPFKVKTIQPGEFVELERFDDYWQGKPYLDGVVYKVIDGSLSSGLLKNGEVDIMQIPNSQYQEISQLPNVELIKEPSLSYTYIGFKLGKWEGTESNGKVVMNNPKFQDKRLRQAMSYALDRQSLLDAFSNGLGMTLDVPMPSVSWAKIDDSKITKYDFNPDKAKQLLDEAGYKDVDGDGFREDPNGKKFTINFDSMSGSDISEPRAQAIMQMWKDVGLNVKLNGGALKEFNLFYDVVMKDDPSVEVFMGAWGLASDPDPTGLWKSTDYWNFQRWYNEESDKLIEEGISEKAFDENYRKEVYDKWQQLVNEELPTLFLFQPIDVTAVNKRLHGVKTNSFSNQIDTQLWWVDQK
ncbi:MAG: oligopeptide ABC transporter substrate-binding protein [Tepidibacillus sp.]